MEKHHPYVETLIDSKLPEWKGIRCIPAKHKMYLKGTSTFSGYPGLLNRRPWPCRKFSLRDQLNKLRKFANNPLLAYNGNCRHVVCEDRNQKICCNLAIPGYPFSKETFIDKSQYPNYQHSVTHESPLMGEDDHDNQWGNEPDMGDAFYDQLSAADLEDLSNRMHGKKQKRKRRRAEKEMGSVHLAPTLLRLPEFGSGDIIKHRSSAAFTTAKRRPISVSFAANSPESAPPEAPEIELEFIGEKAGGDGKYPVERARAMSGEKLLRNIMLDNKIELYAPYGKGDELWRWWKLWNMHCGVQIIDGKDLLNERTNTELRYLKKKPESWRLACQTIVGNKENSGCGSTVASVEVAMTNEHLCYK
ncbi:unnamed protein product [Camellia sinensis]